MSQSKVTIQFNVLPSELLEWIIQWHDQYDLLIATGRLFPKFEFKQFENAAALHKDITDFGLPDEIWLAKKPFVTGRDSRIILIESNLHCFHISFPKAINNGIREALAGGLSEDPDSWKIWQKIAKDIKHRTNPGMWVVNPKTGDKSFSNRPRYSHGIAAALKKGVTVLPFAGNNVLQIEEPD